MVERRLDERPVAGFNLVAVMGAEGLCLHWDGTLRAVDFGAGAHVISSNRDLDDPTMGEKRVFDAMVAGISGAPTRERLESFLGSHEGDRPVCKHGERYGTVSSTIYVDGDAGSTFAYAAGPPCRTPFADCSALLR